MYCLGDHDICWVAEGAQTVMTYVSVSPETKSSEKNNQEPEIQPRAQHQPNPPPPPQKNYIQKTSYICPHRIKLIATPLKFPRILPSKQTKYLAKLVDFLLY